MRDREKKSLPFSGDNSRPEILLKIKKIRQPGLWSWDGLGLGPEIDGPDLFKATLDHLFLPLAGKGTY